MRILCIYLLLSGLPILSQRPSRGDSIQGLPVQIPAFGSRLVLGPQVSQDVISVGHGDYAFKNNPPCQDGTEGERLSIALTALVAAKYGKSAALLAGPLISRGSDELVKQVKGAVAGGTINEVLLSPWTNPRANCALLAVVIPENARINKITRAIQESGQPGWDEKFGYNPEEGAWCGFSKVDIQNDHKTRKQIIFVTFKNWSDDRERTARLTIDWEPVSRGSGSRTQSSIPNR